MKILIVDDHPIVISGLVALLSERDDMEFVTAHNASDGLQLFESRRPDVCVLDINLPDLSGFELARKLISIEPGSRVIVFTMNDDPMLAVEALDCGAKGFVSKNDDPALFAEAVDAVAQGHTWLPSALAQEVALIRASPQHQVRLSSREIEILRLLSRGRSMSEIAGRLDISYKTVASCCSSIRGKLKARTPAEMVRISLAMKLV